MIQKTVVPFSSFIGAMDKEPLSLSFRRSTFSSVLFITACRAQNLFDSYHLLPGKKKICKTLEKLIYGVGRRYSGAGAIRCQISGFLIPSFPIWGQIYLLPNPCLTIRSSAVSDHGLLWVQMNNKYYGFCSNRTLPYFSLSVCILQAQLFSIIWWLRPCNPYIFLVKWQFQESLVVLGLAASAHIAFNLKCACQKQSFTKINKMNQLYFFDRKNYAESKHILIRCKYFGECLSW